MQIFWQDLGYSFRLLRKRPVFTLIAVITLALGVGVNTTVFSLANAILLKPLPVKEPENLISLYSTAKDGSRSARFSYADYADYRDNNEVFTELMAYVLSPLTLGLGESSEPILGEFVSGNYFSTLGINPLSGTLFLPQEDTPGANQVAVVSYHYWQRGFGADASLIGKTIYLNGEPFTVIGITRQDFTGITLGPLTDVWVPLQQTGNWLGQDWLTNRKQSLLRLTGRLKPGVSSEQAQAGMSALANQLAAAHPETNQGKGVALLGASLIEGSRRNAVTIFFAILLAAVGLVLVIACANVANLMLAQAAGRYRETALRQALGASRWRLLRQSITESLVLTSIGGAAGLLASLWTSSLLVGFNPLPSFPIYFDLSIDKRALSFSIFISLATGVAIGVVSALQTRRLNLVSALKDDSRSGAAPIRLRLRNAFVVTQVALSLVLLIGAGLLLRSLQETQNTEPGFDPANRVAMDFDLDLKGKTEEQGRAFYKNMIERITALQGIESVSLANRAPLDISTPTVGVNIEGFAPPPNRSAILISFYRISPDYFQTMSIPLLKGRDFTQRDDQSSPDVVIVNETFAERYWQDKDPLGQRFRLSGEGEGMLAMGGKMVEIIGVAKDSKYRTFDEELTPHIYLPFYQNYQASMTLLVHASGNQAQLFKSIRGELQSLDKDPQGFFARTMFEHMGVALAPIRIASTLVGIFGLLALILATVGLYGAVAYSVSQRTKEIGIRMALGARPSDIFALIIGQGLRVTFIGVVIGGAGAIALTRFLSSLLFGVSATDPTTFISIGLLLITVSLLACYLPARRAMKVDPMIALRYE